MPIWLTIGLDILKALLAGEFKSWWTEHKEKEANEAKNKDAALSDSAAINELHSKWERKD